MLRAQQLFRTFNLATELGPAVRARPELFGDTVHDVLAEAASLTLEDVAEARRVQARGWQECCAFFERYDLMVWPGAAGLAFSAELGEAEIDIPWDPVLLTPSLGLPALAVPFGRTEDGLPTGLQVIGPRHADLLVLQCARAIEQDTGSAGPGQQEDSDPRGDPADDRQRA